LVDGQPTRVAGSGESLSYTIEFRKSGSVPATHVIVSDNLPAALKYESNSLRLGDQALTDQVDDDSGHVIGQQLEIKLDRVAPNEVVHISFRARISGTVAAGGGIVNVANVSGDNTENTSTSPAFVVVDPFGNVFSGRSCGCVLIAGAHGLLTSVLA